MKLASLMGALLWGFAVTMLAVAQATPDTALDALHKAGADANPAAVNGKHDCPPMAARPMAQARPACSQQGHRRRRGA